MVRFELYLHYLLVNHSMYYLLLIEYYFLENSLFNNNTSLLTKYILCQPEEFLIYIASSVVLYTIDPFNGVGIAYISAPVILGGTNVCVVLSNSKIELGLGVVVPIPTCEKVRIGISK